MPTEQLTLPIFDPPRDWARAVLSAIERAVSAALAPLEVEVTVTPCDDGLRSEFETTRKYGRNRLAICVSADGWAYSPRRPSVTDQHCPPRSDWSLLVPRGRSHAAQRLAAHLAWNLGPDGSGPDPWHRTVSAIWASIWTQEVGCD